MYFALYESFVVLHISKLLLLKKPCLGGYCTSNRVMELNKNAHFIKKGLTYKLLVSKDPLKLCNTSRGNSSWATGSILLSIFGIKISPTIESEKIVMDRVMWKFHVTSLTLFIPLKIENWNSIQSVHVVGFPKANDNCEHNELISLIPNQAFYFSWTVHRINSNPLCLPEPLFSK